MSKEEIWNPETARYFRPWSRVALTSFRGGQIVAPDRTHFLALTLATQHEEKIRQLLFEAIKSSCTIDSVSPKQKVDADFQIKEYPDTVGKPGTSLEMIESPKIQAYFHRTEAISWKIGLDFAIVPCYFQYSSKLIISICLLEICRLRGSRYESGYSIFSQAEVSDFLRETQVVAQKICESIWPFYKKVLVDNLSVRTKHTGYLTCEGANSPELSFDPTVFPAIWPEQEDDFLKSDLFGIFRSDYYQSLVKLHAGKHSQSFFTRQVREMQYRAYHDSSDFGLVGFGPSVPSRYILASCEPSHHKFISVSRIFGIATIDRSNFPQREDDPFGNFSRLAMERFIHAF